MHISHDFIATKSCSSDEFLVIFRQVRFETENVRGGRRLEWSAGWGGAG